MRDFNFPVWGTQGCGLVKEVDGIYIFITKPNCPGLDVGDEMPPEWGITPANRLAQEEEDDWEKMYEDACDAPDKLYKSI